MSTALTKAARESLARARKNHEAKFQRVERGAATLLSGYAIAELSKRNILPKTVFNLPVKPVLGVALLFAASKSSGSTRRVLDAAGDAALAIYGYAAGQAGSFVAGDEDVLE
jgi:hypothetical protein